MTDTVVQKRSHPAVLRLRDIRDGNDDRMVFCEGLKILEEAMKSSLRPEAVYCTVDSASDVKNLLAPTAGRVPVTLLADDVMKFVSDLSSPPGVIGLIKRPALASDAPIPPSPKGCFLIVSGAQLPQNVGAMLRTAEGAGVAEVWICEATTDPFGPKAVRGSSGSCFRVPVRVGMKLDQALARLEAAGIAAVAATQNGTLDYDRFDWRKPAALVLGAEGAGFTTEQEALFKTRIRIPMAGKVESLNVATAAAVCLFEAARQRRAS